jgi:hypothetical protein
MNRAALILLSLILLWNIFPARAADRTTDKPVVVDPGDLRTPVPDPEKELTEKYDGKMVIFSGNVHSTGREGSTNEPWYKLAVQTTQEQTSPKAKPKTQTVIVKIFFAGHERRLPTRPAYYTVQGRGEITADGSLIIRNGRTVSLGPKKPTDK